MTSPLDTSPAPGALQTERPMRADAQRNRERILQGARVLFARGESEVLMDEIAREAGVGVGTLYRHFADKEALMGELVRERFVLFNQQMLAALERSQSSSPFDALAVALRENARSVAEDAATRFAFMTGEERVFAAATAEMEEFTALAAELVARAKAAGELRQDFNAGDIPMVMCGVCATIDRRKPDWDWRRHLELVIEGMRARG